MPNVNKNSNSQGLNNISAFLFFLLLSSYPFLSFVWRRDYPFLTTEVLLIFSMVAFMALLLAFTRSRLSPIVTAMLISVLVACVSLAQFNLSASWVLLLAIVVFVLALALRARFYQSGLVLLIAMLIGAWADSLHHSDDFSFSGTGNSNAGVKPPVIHVLLDGFIGVGGLPSYSSSPIFESAISKLFHEFGFIMYPRAYSRYPLTGSSMYAAVNFRDDSSNRFLREELERKKHVMPSNAYFDVLQNAGYRINVYQTEYLDFCLSNQQATDKCWIYGQPNILTIQKVSGAGKRAGMIAKVVLSQSYLLTRATQGLFFDPAIAVYDPSAFSELEKDVLDHPAGRVFFAHILLPHNPYVFLHDCSIRYESNPSLSYAWLSTDRNLQPEVIEYRTMRYFEQADCALQTLRQLFESFKTAGIFEQAYIVIHGDHGSQTSKTYPDVRNLRLLTPEDFKAFYSTLFAVKLPHGEPASDNRVLPLSELLKEFSTLVTGGVENRMPVLSLPKQQSQDETQTAPYVFLGGPDRFTRIDRDIFGDN